MGKGLLGYFVRFFSVFFVLILIADVVNASAVIPFNIESEFLETRAAAIRIVLVDSESSRPIEGAVFQVGNTIDAPFPGNQAITDAQGNAVLSIPETNFDQSMMITVAAVDYPRVSFQGRIDGNRVGESVFRISVRKNRNFSDIQTISGSFSGWPTGISGSRAEVGLFLPAFKLDTLLGFDISSVISPKREEMPVAGRSVRVPANLVMPTQSKRYGFIPIRLSKPNYSMPLLSQMENRFTSVAGSVPISEMVDLARAKDYLGIVNLIEFTHLGISEWEQAGNLPGLPLNLSVENQQRKLKNKVNNQPAGMDLISMGLFDPDQSLRTLIPVDIKSSKASTSGVNMRLAFPSSARSNGDAYVFNAVIDRNQFTSADITALNFSAALQKASWNGNKFEVNESEFLPIYNLGVENMSAREFPFAAAKQPELGASSLNADFLLFNLYTVAKNASEQSTLRTAVWSAILPSSISMVKLPEIVAGEGIPVPNVGHPQTFYWEIIAIRREMTHNLREWDSSLNLSNLRQVSHARKTVVTP